MFDSDYVSTESPEHHTKSKYKRTSPSCMHRHMNAQCVRACMQDIAQECTDTPALSLYASFSFADVEARRCLGPDNISDLLVERHGRLRKDCIKTLNNEKNIRA